MADHSQDSSCWQRSRLWRGGGDASGGGPPPTKYPVTVTGTSGAIQHTAQVTVTVQ
ncbi:MAG TPA: hypothetical protein VEE85_02230 [Candidatus Bathyarchaeia archaeon]|nr:hypothetical protein [Candidatus Bathyarchaeia archaeon]